METTEQKTAKLIIDQKARIKELEAENKKLKKAFNIAFSYVSNIVDVRKIERLLQEPEQENGQV